MTTPHVEPIDHDELVLAHLPQVRTIAARIRRRLPSYIDIKDLTSAGVIGLISAIDKFDPSRDCSFKTFADYKIRGAILDSIRGLDGIPAHKRKYARQVELAIATAQQRLQRSPTEEEIAAELNLDLEAYRTLIMEVGKISLFTIAVSEEQESDLLDVICSDEAESSPASILERSELSRLLGKCIETLTPRERTILDLHYSQNFTFSKIGCMLNLHVSRISQLHAQAILRLRMRLSQTWPKHGTEMVKNRFSVVRAESL